MPILDRITFHVAPEIYYRRQANLGRTSLGPRHLGEWDRALRLPGASSLEDSFLREIQEYFNLSRDEALQRLEAGAEHFASHFADRAPDLGDAKALEEIYDETDLEVFELAEWHVRRFDEGPLNYVLALHLARERGLKRYLDYGSGIGSGAILFARHGFEVTLADVSEPMLKFASWRLEARGLPFRAIHLRSESLPGEAWDVITLLDVLEHLSDPMQLMRKIRDHLEPEGGILIVRAPFDDERPQHIPHEMRTQSRFRGAGYSFDWSQMGGGGLPIVLTRSDRGAMANRVAEFVDYRALGLGAAAVKALQRLRRRVLGRGSRQPREGS